MSLMQKKSFRVFNSRCDRLAGEADNDTVGIGAHARCPSCRHGHNRLLVMVDRDLVGSGGEVFHPVKPVERREARPMLNQAARTMFSASDEAICMLRAMS